MSSSLRLTLLAALLAGAAGAASAQTYQMRVAYPGLKPSAATPAPPAQPAPAPMAQGSLSAATSADFGALATGVTASRSFFFGNTGTAPATGVAVQVPTVPGLTLGANTCGTTAAPVDVPAGSVCQFTLNYGGSVQSSLAGSRVAVTGNFAAAPASLALSGSAGGFSVVAYWASSGRAALGLTPEYLNYGTRTLGVGHDKTFFLIKSGTGQLSGGFTLSGDTSQFQLTRIRAATDEYNTQTCTSGTGIIAADNASVTPCMTTSFPNVMLTLRYAPTVVGNHSVTLTPTTANGSALPAPVVVTASSQFNPTAAWSSVYTSLTTPTPATLSFGAKGAGSVTAKTLYLYNIGTHGSQSVGFVLSGDVAHFRLTGLRGQAVGSYQDTTCAAGAVLSADKLSITPCTAADVSNAYTYSNLNVSLAYAPTAAGNHSVTLTPVTNNNTALPGALVLTGSAQFNAAAAWSTSGGAVVAPTAADLALGAKTVGSSTLKRLVMHNTGTFGNLAVGFVLSGDTTHFFLNKVYKSDRGYLQDCNRGGVVAANKLSATPCHADERNQAAYHGLVFDTYYNPKSAGSHSITITPVTDNGTALPGAITLTGSGQ